jgi:uncharacterized protein (DUF433 family)
MTIVHDEDVLGGEACIEGTRVAVRHVAEGVVDRGRSPAHVADQLDLPLAEVYEALSYYYAHVDEIREAERDNEVAAERARDGSLKPKEPVE